MIDLLDVIIHLFGLTCPCHITLMVNLMMNYMYKIIPVSTIIPKCTTTFIQIKNWYFKHFMYFLSVFTNCRASLNGQWCLLSAADFPMQIQSLNNQIQLNCIAGAPKHRYLNECIFNWGCSNIQLYKHCLLLMSGVLDNIHCLFFTTNCWWCFRTWLDLHTMNYKFEHKVSGKHASLLWL